jgi:uncharacterized protein (TIRG00374 family)
MESRRNQHSRFVAALFCSFVGLWWFIDEVPWSELGEVFAEVKVGWVVLAAVVLLLEFGIRALRWSILLAPLGTTARLRDLLAASVIGAGVNTILPLRAGEIAKPLVAARRTGYPLASVVATSVMERVFDLLGLVSVLLLMVVLLPDAPDSELVTNLRFYGLILGAGAMVGLVGFVVLAAQRDRFRVPLEALLRRLAGPAAEPALHLFDGFIAGLGSTRDPAGLLKAAGLSILMWVNGAGAIYLLFIAFGADLSFAVACFTGVAIALTVAIPQAPGFIGVFHVAMEKTMVLWGLDAATAGAFAIVFWAVSFVPVTAIALVALWREGLSLRSFRGPSTGSDA